MFENTLEAEPQPDYREIQRAYFTPAKKDRNRGAVSVKLMDGQVFEFEGILRSSFYKWAAEFV